MNATVAALAFPGPLQGAMAEGAMHIRDHEFQRLRDLIARLSGIELAGHKKGLLVGRLGRRLRELGIHDFEHYYALVNNPANSQERQVLLNLITTNETYFFREDRHLQWLQQKLLPQLATVNEIRLWSAACSSGEEAYSLAMIIDEARRGRGYQILGTDISERVLNVAQQGIYPLEAVAKIPRPYLQQYCLQGVRAQVGNLRVVRRLREHTEFRKLNLNDRWPELGRFHVIFLRNVMIYFNQQTKRELVHKLAERLHPGGHLIVGLSETINGMHDGFSVVAPSIYRWQG